MQLSTPIVGDAILLRMLQPEDVSDGYLGWLNDPEITRYLEVRFSPPKTIEELRRFVQSVNSSDESLILGIFLRGNHVHIGNIKLGPINRHHSAADIGILIGDKGQWGKGYASIAISLLTDYALESLGLAKLTAGSYIGNEGSTRAFLRAGFVIEGRRHSQWQVGEQRQDGLLFGKVNPRQGNETHSMDESNS